MNGKNQASSISVSMASDVEILLEFWVVFQLKWRKIAESKTKLLCCYLEKGHRVAGALIVKETMHNDTKWPVMTK